MYADIVLDIRHEALDRPFQYRIPKELEGRVEPGVWVEVPFGSGGGTRRGMVVHISAEAKLAEEKIKPLTRVVPDGISADKLQMSLAYWMHREYGGSFAQALQTVMPVRRQVKRQEERLLVRTADNTLWEMAFARAEKRHAAARLRLMQALADGEALTEGEAKRRLMLTAKQIADMEAEGLLSRSDITRYRSDFLPVVEPDTPPLLNAGQQAAVDGILQGFASDDRRPVLLHGVTGSGKTEVYMRLIADVLEKGGQAIVLIPEIALTHQAVSRYCARFGSLVSMINSRLSEGERFDQFERAKNGDAKVMIGPRSALFTPFPRLGLVIIDEEQEGAYNSETVPRYRTRETAGKLCALTGAFLVLGSATPSVEAYSRAMSGSYRLVRLNERAVSGSTLPVCHIVDMRRELAENNRSVFSRLLREKMEQTLARKKQMMLFINRRGFSKTVSCRSCGEAIGCPHCAVSLTEHVGGWLMCHYCGYTRPMPLACPNCGSGYLAGFGLGTQKVELMLQQQLPGARILRMDLDTTGGKHGHDAILGAFGRHEADILLGTQMIVKGHDFPEVALVGILAADMSLYAPDFRSMEKTFQLITQAAGRAGRGRVPGEVVIQTYAPDNFSIRTAARADYESFFREEYRYRERLSYPPCGELCELMAVSAREEHAQAWIERMKRLLNARFSAIMDFIGPANAPVARVKDMWRKHLYFRTKDHRAYNQALELIGEQAAEAKKEKVFLYVTKE